MWDETKQARLDELRRREQEGMLTSEGREVLERLLHELEQEEWRALRPALGHLHEEPKQLQEELSRFRHQNALLAALAERQENLLRRAQAQLAGLLSEHEMLKAEYEHITGRSLRTASS
jgi:hypothetical protein